MVLSPCFRLIKSSINCIGPGRYNATMAIMSSKTVGFSSRKYRFIPADSSWNTPVVSPRWNNLKVSSSSSGILARSISVLYTFLIIRKALLIIVKFERPKKSILSRPISSTGPIGYCVATTPFCDISTGANFTISSGAITTPAACTPWLRIVPSRRIAKSSTRFEVWFVSYSFFKSGSSTTLLTKGMWRP